MSPDNIGSAVNRFSGWPSNDPLKTDKESMTSPMTVQVIKMIAAILDPHRIVVGIDTLYTTQRETFTSESQQLIESALQTLHVMNLNNLETNRTSVYNISGNVRFEYISTSLLPQKPLIILLFYE